MARRSRLGWVVALVLLCSACTVDATVTVKVREDGSGFVRVDVTADAEAVQTAEVGGGKLEDRVRLSDLPAAGWTVAPWVRNPDGSASLTLRKPFTSVDQVPAILDELNGEYGPLESASFTRTRSFFATDFEAIGVVDLGSMSTGITQDSELVARLQAEGVDVNGIDQQLLAQLKDAFSVRLVVDLPGRGKTVVEPAPGAAATLTASASVDDTTRIYLVVVAGLLVVAALLVAIWPRRRGRRRRGRPHMAPAPHTAYRQSSEPPLRRSGRSADAPLSWDDATSPTRPRTPPGS
jgi:hypothetical protein